MLSNKEVVDIVSSVCERSSAARALVETAVKTWRYKYPTSKVDDCAVVCLFLINENHHHHHLVSTASATNEGVEVSSPIKQQQQHSYYEMHHPSDMDKDKDKDWSAAADGVSRVNTLLNLPRFMPSAAGKDDKEKKRH